MKVSPRLIAYFGAVLAVAWAIPGYGQAQQRVEIRYGTLRTVQYIAQDPKDQAALNAKAQKENEQAVKDYFASRLPQQFAEEQKIQSARRDALLAYYQHATHYALGFRPVSQLFPYYVGYPGPIGNPVRYWWGPSYYWGYGYGGYYGGLGYGYGNLGRPAFYPKSPDRGPNKK